MKTNSKALALAAQNSTRSFQRFTLIRTTHGQLLSPSLQRIRSAGHGLEPFKALRIDVLPESNLAGEFGDDVISAGNTKISARAKELRVRWITKPAEIIEVTNLREF